MSKHLLLNGDPHNNWPLPADTDLGAVQSRLRSGLIRGEIVEIEVELGEPPPVRTTLLISGRLVTSVAVVELPERGPRTTSGAGAKGHSRRGRPSPRPRR